MLSSPWHRKQPHTRLGAVRAAASAKLGRRRLRWDRSRQHSQPGRPPTMSRQLSSEVGQPETQLTEACVALDCKHLSKAHHGHKAIQKGALCTR